MALFQVFYNYNYIIHIVNLYSYLVKIQSTSDFLFVSESVIDRKKNMLKLSQGEYVALEKVENAYQNILCNQLWLYGNSYHSKYVLAHM